MMCNEIISASAVAACGWQSDDQMTDD